ncbi:MAG: hypothetical protein ACK4PI_11420 [Tepidisphaerales bacterium]
MRTTWWVLAAAVVSAATGVNAATVTNTSPTVTQNFNTLAFQGTTNSFAAWATSTGQAWQQTSNLGLPAGGQYIASNGGSTQGSIYSFGATNSTERALGSVASGSTATLYYGLLVSNGGTTAITELAIAYVGEQWRNGGNTTAHTLAFEYSTTATTIGAVSGYIAVPSLDFTGPIATSTASSLDGNLPANRVSISGVITGLNILPGQSVRIRWVDINDAGNDHGLAIDDFALTARFAPDVQDIPLPAAAVAAPGLLALTALRRRR